MKAKILVVDDEQGIRDLFYYMLTPLGYEIDSAVDGVEGIELFEKNKYDIIFLDVHMPRMQGPAVLKMIKQIKPDQTVIIFSSSSDPNFRFESEAKNLGAYTCIYKPFELEEILKIINEVLAKR